MGPEPQPGISAMDNMFQKRQSAPECPEQMAETAASPGQLHLKDWARAVPKLSRPGPELPHPLDALSLPVTNEVIV